MIYFFRGQQNLYYFLQSSTDLQSGDIEKLKWLFGNADLLPEESLNGFFTGPRKEMITPWSTNAVEITQNMGIKGIERIEEFYKVESSDAPFDPMLQQIYKNPGQFVFKINHQPEPVEFIFDIAEYNKAEGLAMSEDEVAYLNEISVKIGRKLTDSEVYGFAQLNSEHCRHKIFNGTFVLDGKEMPETLFSLIKKTSKENPNNIVSAYKDNVAFINGPKAEQFAPERQDIPDFFVIKNIETVISLKAETHNFPTTVEPFNGAATGSGGEIRDRLAGGKGSLPIAGTAVYVTSYPRLEEGRNWEEANVARPWLYQSPDQILIKASNGASDFGNKFGQPLICGSLLTFEIKDGEKQFGYDKVVMMAGGIGFAKKQDSLKEIPQKGDKIIVMGGDNYRIGMGGGAVSSVATGEFKNSIELNAVQRSNPEMQKRVANAIRALTEMDVNPIVSIHDHGAGGHFNSISELVEETGGVIDMNKLPVGDPTLSAREILGNESQERMGMVLNAEHVNLLSNISERERAPLYIAGDCTGDHHLTFENNSGRKPVDIELTYLLGKPPKTILEDKYILIVHPKLKIEEGKLHEYLKFVLSLESVACKDWLTNKVDRSVTGRVALQQCAGEIQLPLNNLGVVAIDYQGQKGIATAIGHSPFAAMIDPEKGSVLSIAEALTNIIWAPIEGGLSGISLSANWMWPAKNEGEDYRLYQAVKAVSEFAIELGINIPTGKDSLSMTQKYPDGQKVFSPGTVIITAVGEVSDINKVIKPVLQEIPCSGLIYVNLSGDELKLSGSALAQVLNQFGDEVPTVKDSKYFSNAFNTIQQLIIKGKILSGHDISAGGMITALLEMCFTSNRTGLEIDLSELNKIDIIRLLFAENPGIIIQAENTLDVLRILKENGISHLLIGTVSRERKLNIYHQKTTYQFDINELRDTWYKTSFLFDQKQSGKNHAQLRFDNYKQQELKFEFLSGFTGQFDDYEIQSSRKNKSGIRAAIIREKGVNGDREMAYMLHLAGFDVKDVHMTDLISGRENLEEINFIVFVGGFSNSDVLGSGKGWAGAFLYNEKAKQTLKNFYDRKDTLSLGVCNGCQVVVELGLVYPDHEKKPKMHLNDSHKFESAFLTVDVLPNNSILLNSLAGSKLGIWVAHGEGKFEFPYEEEKYQIPMKYAYAEYPGNPNGSEFNTAAICSEDGRHLAMMPHLERSFFPWHWAHYPSERKDDQVTPWIDAFVNAREWIKKQL